MKKKALIFICVLSLFLCSCSSGSTDIKRRPTLPWSQSGRTTTEYCRYKATRYLEVGADGRKIITTADSYLDYTIKEGYGVRLNENDEPEIIDDPLSTVLTAELSLTYLNENGIPEIYAGQTEYIYSVALFNRYDLSAKFTYKKTNVAELPDDNLNYTLWADYTGEYLSSNKPFAKLKDKQGNEKTLTIKAAGYYDNESVFYLFRSLQSIGKGGTQTLDFAHPYEDFLTNKKKLKTKGIKHTTNSEFVDIDLNPETYASPEIYPVFFERNVTEYKLACYETALSLTSSKSGPPIKLYYSSVPTRSATVDGLAYNAYNVLVKIEYPTYGTITESLALNYTQVFELFKYSND